MTSVALDREGRLELDDLTRKAGGKRPAACARAPGGQQRDRRDPARSRGRRKGPCGRRNGGLRRCPGFWPDGLPFRGDRRRRAFRLQPQARRPQGRGRRLPCAAVMPPSAYVRGGGQERGFRGGTENVAAHRRFRRRGEASRARTRVARLAACAKLCRQTYRKWRRKPPYSGQAAPRLKYLASRCRASPPKPWSRRSMSRAWRFRRVRPAPPAKSPVAGAGRDGRRAGDLARCALRITLGWTK